MSRNASAIEWQPSTIYRVGQIVDFPEDEDYSYQLIGFRRMSVSPLTIPQSFGDKIVVDDMVWKYYNNRDSRGDYKSPDLSYEWNQYLHIDYNLSITD
jgi:hypothetical protein